MDYRLLLNLSFKKRGRLYSLVEAKFQTQSGKLILFLGRQAAKLFDDGPHMNGKDPFNKLSPGLSKADVDDSTVFKISPTDYETTLLQRIDNCDYVALADEQLLSIVFCGSGPR